MGGDKLKIYYNGYYDAPLSFLVNYKGATYYFARGFFDDELDEFPSEYEVFQMEKIFSPECGGVLGVYLKENERTLIGKINFSEVPFDLTKRREIDSAVFEKFLPSPV
jgi:hypothetical protein